MRLPLLLAVLAPIALALGACADNASSPARPGPVPVVSAPELLAQRLPAEAAGFGKAAAVPVRQPYEGVEVPYATPGRTAAGYVQVLRPPGDGAALPDGTSAPVVQSEYQRMVGEAARGSGPSRRMQVVSELNQPEDSPLFRCAELEGVYGRQPVQSIICVGAAGGQLLRVRASMPRRDPPLADLRALLRDIGTALRG